jgi:hypothetical protein
MLWMGKMVSVLPVEACFAGMVSGLPVEACFAGMVSGLPVEACFAGIVGSAARHFGAGWKNLGFRAAKPLGHARKFPRRETV